MVLFLQRILPTIGTDCCEPIQSFEEMRVERSFGFDVEVSQLPGCSEVVSLNEIDSDKSEWDSHCEVLRRYAYNDYPHQSQHNAWHMIISIFLSDFKVKRGIFNFSSKCRRDIVPSIVLMLETWRLWSMSCISWLNLRTVSLSNSPDWDYLSPIRSHTNVSGGEK